MTILLMGNPNVGKSVVFNRLTGAAVIASNYAGTTVEFTKGASIPIETFDKLILCVRISKITLVTKSAVNTLATIPTMRVRAKPLIGPVPKL